MNLTPHPRAVADALPMFLPAIPFGFVVGAASAQSVLPPAVAAASPSILFAGSAHLAMLAVLGPATWWAAILAGLVVNSRHLMYSAAVSPRFSGQPRWFRWIGPYFLMDQSFALASTTDIDDRDEFRHYYLTVGLVFLVGWNLACGVGLLFGGSVPDSWRLEFAPVVMFAGLVVMGVAKRSQVVAAGVGGAVAYLTLGLPNKAAIIIGGVAGVAAGTVAARGGAARGDA